MNVEKVRMTKNGKVSKARNRMLTIRFTEKELLLIDDAVKKANGTTRGRFVRSLVLNAISKT
jgi:hypothetical protein